MPMPALSGPPAKAARAIQPTAFGGGWIIPLTPEGERTLTDYFQEPCAYLPPVGKHGWIIEPWQTLDVREALEAAGLDWER